MNVDRVSGGDVAGDGERLGEWRRRCARAHLPEAEARTLEADREQRLHVDVDLRSLRRAAAGRRRTSRTGRRRGRRIARLRCDRCEVGGVVARVGAAGCAALRGGRARERGRAARALVVGRAAVADEIADRGRCGATPGGGTAREYGRVLDQGDLATGCGEVRRAGGVGRRQRGSDGGGRRELDQVMPAGCDRTAERGRRPARTGRARILDGPVTQVDAGGAGVEELDEVVREGRAGVPTAGVDLADDDARRRADGGRDERSEQREQQAEKNGDSIHGQLRSDVDEVHPS